MKRAKALPHFSTITKIVQLNNFEKQPRTQAPTTDMA
jgi:hypothetical protein